MINGKKRKNQTAILQVLVQSAKALHSSQIARLLQPKGVELNERSVRLYLQDLEKHDLTVSQGRRGHTITAHGTEELKGATVVHRLGFMSAHLDAMMYQMNFDLATGRGSVIVNLSFVPQQVLLDLQVPFYRVFEKGYSMGTLMGLHLPGETVGTTGPRVPAGYFGVCTVASVTFNGILLRHGVPVRSISSGLLDLHAGKPTQVAELIAYDATSVDPLHLFISAGMTNYLGAIKNGNGRIGICFREVPAESHDQVKQIAQKVRQWGLGAFLEIGLPQQNLLNMPVQQGSCGVIGTGGLDPVAIFVESGHRIESHPVCSSMEYHRLFPYTELPERLKAMEHVSPH